VGEVDDTWLVRWFAHRVLIIWRLKRLVSKHSSRIARQDKLQVSFPCAVKILCLPHRQLATIAATSQRVGALHAGALAADDPREGEAKVLAEESVDARVDGGIEVA